MKVNLGSPGVENIPQVPGKQAEVDQNHDARNAVKKFSCVHCSANQGNQELV